MWVGGDLLMLLVAVQWSASGQQARLGSWLESTRRQTLTLTRIGPDTGTDSATVGASRDVDDDEEALQAYNRMLAELHRRYPGPSDGC